MIIKSKARNMGSCVNFVNTCILKNAIYIVLKTNGAISIFGMIINIRNQFNKNRSYTFMNNCSVVMSSCNIVIRLYNLTY
jgi:hypothetical protein